MNIASLLFIFFAKFMPEIITSGRLYRLVAPLYRIDEKAAKKYMNGVNYLFDKKDYFGMCHKIVADNLKIMAVEPRTKTDILKGAGPATELSKKQLIKLLGETTEYLPELETLVKRSACNMEVLEYICYFLVMTSTAPHPKKEFENLMTKKFPELHYDSIYDSIMGSFNGENITLIIDNIFMSMARRFFKMVAEAPVFYILCKNRNAKEDPAGNGYDLMTLGQFLKMAMDAYQIPIEQRYKGLGESDADMVFPSMMNPKTRKLLRVTMDDVEKSMHDLELIHGDGEKLRAARRKMLIDADITLEDIDN